MKTVFILGRNPELSRAEVVAFLGSRNKDFSELVFKNNILLLDIEDNSNINIQEFGGVLKIGKVGFEGSVNDFESYLDSNDIIPSDKFSYSIFGNIDPDPLKKKFKREKRKAVLKHGRVQLEFQDGSKSSLPKANFHLFLYEDEGKIYFGNIAQNYDYSKVEERDMGKPARREHLAISPRLAKILINLSWAKKGNLLLDPFCGIGGILQEALLKEIRCFGVDKDKKAISGAKKNLIWLFKNYKIRETYRLKYMDSRDIENLQFSAIATETPLGKVLRKKPSEKEAKKIILDFERFIFPILQRLKVCKQNGARIAITFPAINGLRVNAAEIAKDCDLKIVTGPILESRPGQFISRDIVVFQ